MTSGRAPVTPSHTNTHTHTHTHTHTCARALTIAHDAKRYDGKDLAETYGIVVIAANYRLDALGWMALAEMEAESPTGSFGNFGLQDQGLALNWTQVNAMSE
jgi:carboxylesterase type B